MYLYIYTLRSISHVYREVLMYLNIQVFTHMYTHTHTGKTISNHQTGNRKQQPESKSHNNQRYEIVL